MRPLGVCGQIIPWNYPVMVRDFNLFINIIWF